MDLAVLADHRVKIRENEKERLTSCQRAKNLRNMKVTVISTGHKGDINTNFNWCTWNDPQRLSKRTGEVRNRRTSGDHPNYCIVVVGQNTEKSPGDLRRLAVTQTPWKESSAYAAVKNALGVN